jgi:hypothetical protein
VALACAMGSFAAFRATANPQSQLPRAVVVLIGSQTVEGDIEVYIASSSMPNLDCRNGNLATVMATLLELGFHLDRNMGLTYTLVRYSIH